MLLFHNKTITAALTTMNLMKQQQGFKKNFDSFCEFNETAARVQEKF
jgi:hypothetical protein